jgi:threonine dehydratase
MLDNNDIKIAHKRIRHFINKTPVLTNQSLNKLFSAKLFFKCENFQKTGSFKIRGATNAVLQLKKSELRRCVITASSGNHGAALAMAVSKRGGVTKVVMPKNTPKTKVNNVIRNGGDIIWCEANQISRENTLKKLLLETQGTIIHPYNDLKIIEGQATIAKELLFEVPDLDAIICPVSGGGLLSGILNYVKRKNPNILVYGAEPIKADDTYRSIKVGEIQSNKETNTVCDGLRAQVGTITFPIIKELVDGILTVSEDRIIKYMKMIFDRMKIVVEPSCSIALGAISKNKKLFKNRKVGIILSGGNVNLDRLPWS